MVGPEAMRQGGGRIHWKPQGCELLGEEEIMIMHGEHKGPAGQVPADRTPLLANEEGYPNACCKCYESECETVINKWPLSILRLRGFQACTPHRPPTYFWGGELKETPFSID
uniref:Uncharacterized protein n=1 Tax=Eutreptiella gymnastica TaxID=73025 RepID=A0A7S1NDJ3_9EUGL|mmetsp:Transcript_19225/g.33999  ORF Transcript_19225/g.33999 Transcript_19225/m.33999 type:complete len:112 (+) Transcript_19225:426-761(+)